MVFFNIVDNKNKIDLNSSKLAIFIEELCKLHKMNIDLINFNFCSRKEIKKINYKSLKHNYVTDVICFDYTTEKKIYADIYICAKFIKNNADIYNINFKTEIHRVIFHSILHILGFDDKLFYNQYTIRKAENLLINKYFKNG